MILLILPHEARIVAGVVTWRTASRPDRRSGDGDEADGSKTPRRWDEERWFRLNSGRILSGHMRELRGWNIETVPLKHRWEMILSFSLCLKF